MEDAEVLFGSDVDGKDQDYIHQRAAQVECFGEKYTEARIRRFGHVQMMLLEVKAAEE